MERRIEEAKPIPLTPEEVKLVQGFYTSDYLTHREGLAMRHEGTCQWIFEHRGYLDWYKASEQTILWVSGNPGMGKTILASAVIETLELQTSNTQKVIYFFCDDKYDNQRSFAAILRGLVHQLLLTDTKNRVEKYVRPHEDKKELHNSLAALWDIFVSIIEEKEGTTICILDALDECEETSRGHFFMFIQEFFSKPASKAGKGKLKLLFTSRPYDSIRWEFLGLPEEMQLRIKAEAEEELINRDIMAYIDSEVERLAKLRRYDAALKNLVLTSLKTRADGSFLWASLVLRILLKTPTSKVEQRLKAFPAELESVYSRIMIEMSRDARSMLVWITHAVRPMTLPDLAAALEIEHGDSEDATYLVDTVIVQRLKADLELCYPLVKINTDGETETVHLVHQTAKEFLQDKCQEWGLDRPTSHNEIALSCLVYLRSAHMKRGPIQIYDEADQNFGKVAQFASQNKLLPIIKKWPFLAYATLNWYKHVLIAESSYAGELWKPVYRSLTAGPKTELSEQLMNHFGSQMGYYVPGISACEKLCSYGMEKILKLCYENIDDFLLDTPCSTGMTPLQAAASAGNLEIVKFLVETGKVDVNSVSSGGQTPVSCAADTGHLNIVRYLVETANASINHPGTTDAPGIVAAITNGGHMEVLRYLLSLYKVEPGATSDPTKFSPVEAAIYDERLDMLQLLVESGKADAWLRVRSCSGVFAVSSAARGPVALLKYLVEETKMDPDLKNEDNSTPLTCAAQHGRLDSVEYLLSTGRVDINVKVDGTTPLMFAAEGGFADVVRALVNVEGIKLEARKTRHARTPLSKAAGKGHVEVVKVLVGTGRVVLESKDGKFGRTPLGWAARNGEIETIKFLTLDAKCDINAKDKEGRTPLSLAVAYYHYEVVIFLIENGADLETVDNEGKSLLHWSQALRDKHPVDAKVMRWTIKEQTLKRNGKKPLQ